MCEGSSWGKKNLMWLRNWKETALGGEVEDEGRLTPDRVGEMGKARSYKAF